MDQIDNIDNSKDVIFRYTEDGYMKSDVEEIHDVINSESGYEEVSKKMDQDWSFYNELNFPKEKTKYLKEARTILNKIGTKSKFRFTTFLKYAAVSIGTFIVCFGAIKLINQSRLGANDSYISVIVEKGERKKVILPDKSEVTLNSGSYIRYPSHFDSDIRTVEIDGEAFFNVTHDSNRPFIVQTRDVKVKVLGTSFNVRAYATDEELSVSVKTGKVQVNMPEATFSLKHNEQFVLNKTKNEFYKENSDSHNFDTWTTGNLHFDKTPVKDVIKELERIYNCKIDFTPGANYDEYIYGEHDNKSLESVLNSIAYSTNIKYRKEGDKYILYK